MARPGGEDRRSGRAKPAEPAKRRKLRLGEYLIQKNLIDRRQLEDALASQKRLGGFLGSHLIKLGFVDEGELLRILSIDLDVPAVSLSKIRIAQTAQALVPYEVVKTYRVIPLGERGGKIILAMPDPTDHNMLKELEFRLGKPVKPMVTTELDIDEALSFFERNGYGRSDYSRQEPLIRPPSSKERPRDIFQILDHFVNHPTAEILYMTAGSSPAMRAHGKMERLGLKTLTAEEVEHYAHVLMNDLQKARLIEESEIDFTLSWRDVGRFRLAVYRQRGSLSLVVRKLTDKIPDASRLGLPPWTRKLVELRQGLVIAAAPSGHGRSTTLAALLDMVNETRAGNIITLEDPIKFLHRHKKGNVNQREIGSDTPSFAAGFRRLFIQAPDVILLPDLTDRERVAAAVAAANSGRLVLAGSPSGDGVVCLERIVDIFPPQDQNQIRANLSDCLAAVITQRLFDRVGGRGRVAAFGKILGSERIRHAIRMRQLDMLYQQTQARLDDLEYIEIEMARLVREGRIAEREAILQSPSEARFREFLKMKLDK